MNQRPGLDRSHNVETHTRSPPPRLRFDGGFRGCYCRGYDTWRRKTNQHSLLLRFQSLTDTGELFDRTRPALTTGVTSGNLKSASRWTARRLARGARRVRWVTGFIVSSALSRSANKYKQPEQTADRGSCEYYPCPHSLNIFRLGE
jgi:hypothetical protein